MDYDFPPMVNDLSVAMGRKFRLIQIAVKAAIDDVASDLKIKARSDIAAAGFGGKWQNALRVKVYPKGPSANAAIFLYHNISYAWIFERGATIQGARFLWIPMPNVPVKMGKRRMSPKELNESGVALVLAKDKGHFPMLFANLTLSARKAKAINAGKKPKLSKADIIWGAKKGKTAVARTPLFVGVPSVTIRQRFHIMDLCMRAYTDLPARYRDKLKDE